MMKNKYLFFLIIAVFAIFNTSCDDFLDEMPDNRTEIDSPKKITQLLVSAYPQSSFSILAELSSDNFVDNNSPDPLSGEAYNLSPAYLFHNEIFAWEPVTLSSTQDSPNYVWLQTYKAISTANHALAAIEELEAKGVTEDMSAQRGEALLCRAYGHFILVNLFSQAYKNEEASSLDLGIPYATKPETTLAPSYDRGTVAEVYRLIQKDIEEGIDLISDDKYVQPYYHFNKKAAYAFAARFFLYKREYKKVVEYANLVLGSDPASVLRNWTKKYEDLEPMANDYVLSTHPCNLLINTSISTFYYLFLNTRYGFARDARYGTIAAGPTWTTNIFDGQVYQYSSGGVYGVVYAKTQRYFEYEDVVAQYGLARQVNCVFTTDETLLCRAEALLYLGETKDAIADLNLWATNRGGTTELTEEVINNFYTESNKYFVNDLNPSVISPDFVIPAGKEPIVNCILHFRRLETLYDGLRWFDIKRYAMVIEHAIGENKVDVLEAEDPRRAIQLSLEVISAGIVPNPVPVKNVVLPREQANLEEINLSDK